MTKAPDRLRYSYVYILEIEDEFIDRLKTVWNEHRARETDNGQQELLVGNYDMPDWKQLKCITGHRRKPV